MRFLLSLLLVACSAAPPPSAPPVEPPPVEPPPSTPCTAPQPDPSYACVQDCGPPVVRDGDPEPAWRWLSSDEVAAREMGGCPRCLPPGARIATPTGDVAVASLRAGDVVWTTDAAGTRIAAPLLDVRSRSAPPTHALLAVRLSDGRTVTASAGHPTARGVRLDTLAIGAALDGATVVEVLPRSLLGDATWDLLPAGPTGTYWADGVLLGSTLAPR